MPFAVCVNNEGYEASLQQRKIYQLVELAETDVEDVSGTGVVITGSVVSAGDGRALAGLAPA